MDNKMINWSDCDNTTQDAETGEMLAQHLVQQAAADYGVQFSDEALDLAYEVGSCTYAAGVKKGEMWRWPYLGMGVLVGLAGGYAITKMRSRAD